MCLTSGPEIIVQEDTFFRVPQGRLKVAFSCAQVVVPSMVVANDEIACKLANPRFLALL